MFQFGSCPRCQSELSDERLSFQPIVCGHCGYTPNMVQKTDETKFEKRFLKVGIGIALALGVGFVQAASWDKHAVSIIPLKIKQFTAMASQADLSKIAEICIERLKHDCVESALASKAFNGDNESFADLGKYQARRMKKSNAVQSFTKYFQNGGQDLEATYQFAKVLGETGQADQSAATYKKVLEAKPETLQITVVQNYVKMLVAHGRSAEAIVVIDEIRKSSTSANMFMETEYKTLKLSQASR